MSDKLRAAAQAAYKAMIAAELSDGSKREWEAAVDGLKAALAEPAIKESLTVAEPVAWMTRFDDPERSSYGKLATTHLTQDEAERQAQRHIQKKLCKLRIEPSYAAQPRKEWVGLTEDEVFDLADENLYNGGKNYGSLSFNYGVLSFYKDIEAKLKEQNNG
jgi:hypothetical protein